MWFPNAGAQKHRQLNTHDRAPTGRPEFPEEAYIKKLDGSTGASLKLTILNHHGRVWTMVAGGGASVVYADTISDYGFGKVR